MSNLLERLNEQRLRTVTVAREIAERAAAGESLSATDEVAYERADGEISRLSKLITAEKRRIDSEAEMTAAFGAAMTKAGGRSESRGSQVGVALRSAFDTWKAGGDVPLAGMTLALPEQRAGESILKVVTPTRGPETVPVTLVDTLYSKLFDDSAVLSSGVTILRTDSGESIKLPRMTALAKKDDGSSFGVTDARVGEGAEATLAGPTFDQVQFDAWKYMQFTQLSRELAEDSILDIETVVGMVLGRNLGNMVGLDLTLGTGASQPRGVRTIAALNVVNTATGGLWGTNNIPADADKFLDVVAKLKPQYRRNGRWLVNDQSVFYLRKIKMNNEYAWSPSIAAGQPDTFLGYPIITDANIAVPASGAGVTAVFFDPSMYIVRQVRSMRLEWSTEYGFAKDLLTCKAAIRMDGDSIDDAAFAGYNSVT